MRVFAYQRVPTANAATQAAAAASSIQASFLAGGTTLFDLMKLEVMRPQTVIDINPLDRTAHGRITVDQKGLHLGALVAWRTPPTMQMFSGNIRSSLSR